MNSILFFDVDQTLVRAYTGYYATLELIRRKIIKKRRLPIAIFYKVVSSIYYGDVRKMYEVGIADMVGCSIDEIMKIGEEVFKRNLKALIYKEALARIEKAKQQAHPVILISSGPYMVVKALQEFVGADDSFAIGPVVENKILQNRLMEPFCFMEGKVVIAQQQATQRGIGLKQCSFYADSIHDFPLLSAVGFPHVVNPDCKLRKQALSHRWPILEFKTLLGED